MLKNYFKIAWRNLLKQKGFSLINIIGLSIGIAACILISLFVYHETSYGKQVPNHENIYRLTQYFDINGEDFWGAHQPAIMASTVKNEFDEVQNAGRIMDNNLLGGGDNEVAFGNSPEQYHESGFAYADQSVLDIFHIPFLRGNATTALNAPNTIVISGRKAKKYFGDQNPVGKPIYIDGKTDRPFQISCVFKDFPENSNLQYDYLISLAGVEFGPGEQTRWTQRNYFNFIQLKPGTDFSKFQDRLTQVMFKNYILPAYRDAGRTSDAELLAKHSVLELQPLLDMHLYSEHIPDGHTRGDIRLVWIFAAIALFILLIACINFVNLSTAKSAGRAKEVGIRKVVGSNRKGLIFQFLTESVLIAGIAFLLGLTLASILLPYFNQIAGIQIHIPWYSPVFWLSLIFISGFIGILAGLYPALYLSGFNVIHTLKGSIKQGKKSGYLRSGLVVFQFAISIALIVGTLIIWKQMDFILTKKIGYNKEQVIQIEGIQNLGDQIGSFKNEVKNITDVKNASLSDFLPIEGAGLSKRNSNGLLLERQKDDKRLQTQVWPVDKDYINTLGMELVSGRNFSDERGSDDQAVIVNESFVHKIGLKSPLGKRIVRGENLYTIIGVVADFNFESLKSEVGPVALFYSKNNISNVLSVKAGTTNMPLLLNSLQQKWKEFALNLPFRYTFMDASYAHMYDNVRRMGQLFIVFAILALFVACLGLFALASFIAEQRRKEMSVRKVLGASVKELFRLLTIYFIKLVGIALVIAVPISFYAMHKWLQDYAYRIDITWQIFALSGAFAFFIALATISYHALKIAFINPATTLRND